MFARRENNQASEQLSVKALRGGFWQMGTVSAQAVLQLLVIGLLSRLLGPPEFAQAAVASVVMGFAAMLSDMGMAAAVVQRSNLSAGDAKLAFVVTVLLGILFAAVIYLGSGLVERIVRISGSGVVVSVGGVGVLLTSFGAVSRALLQRSLSFRKLFIVDVLANGIAYLGVGVPLAMNGYGVWALIGAFLIQSLLQSALLMKMQPIPWHTPISFTAMKGMFSFGGGLTLTRLFNYVATAGDQILVGRMLGSVALGTYERMMRILAWPSTYLGNVLENVLFPVMSRVQEDERRFAEGFSKSMSIVWLLLGPLSVLLYFMTPEVVSVLLGPGWEMAIAPLQILFLTLPFRTSIRIMDSLVRAKGAVYRSALRRILFALAVVLGVVLGSTGGLVGVSIGVGLANLVLFALMLNLCFGITTVTSVRLIRAMAPGLVLGVLVVAVAGLFSLTRVWVPLSVLVRSVTYPLVSSIAVVLFVRRFPHLVGDLPHELYSLAGSLWTSSLRSAARRREAPAEEKDAKKWSLVESEDSTIGGGPSA